MTDNNNENEGQVDFSALDEDQLDDVIRKAKEAKVDRMITTLDPLRQRYVELLTEITETIRPFGIATDKFLSSDRATLRKYLLNRLEKKAGASEQGQVGRPKRVMRIPPKYRNKENPELTWTGRGNKPLWVKAYEAEGGRLADLEIKAVREE